MTAIPNYDINSLIRAYGDPRGKNGLPSPAWEAINLTKWKPPYQMYYSDGAKTKLTSIRVHKAVVDMFDAAFHQVLRTFGQARISRLHLDVTGGVYCYRLERGGSRLSVHSWAIAIDIDPANNPYPRKWRPGIGMVDPEFTHIMQESGFWWRGEDGDCDPMHYQACKHVR